MTRDNTKLIQAHIPVDLKKNFDKKLVDTDRTMQNVLSDFIEQWSNGSNDDLLARLREIRTLTGDMMIGKVEKDLLRISIALDDLIHEIVYGKIK